MKDDVYRSIDRISFSSLKDIFVSYELFDYNRKHKREPTREMIFGTALHHLILGTPYQVKLLPSGSPISKKYIAELAELKKTTESDDVFVSEEDFDVLQQMKKNADEHSICQDLLLFAEFEQPLFFEIDGVECKGKIDVIAGSHLADVKTTNKSDISEFSRTVVDYKYHMQAAMYHEAAIQNGYQPVPFFFIVCSKVPPYNVQVIKLSEAALQLGRKKMFDAIQLYQDAKHREFKSPQKIITVDLPPWYKG